jgi:succinate dehydrogenase / fumarate reductase cytochrome b subunit
MPASRAVRELLRLFLSTTIGRKMTMALTGLGAIGFLMAHLAGNTTAFGGAKSFNDYAEKLHSIPFLPVMEAGLAAMFLIHILMGVAITLQNSAARPLASDMRRSAGAETVASRTMIYTGLIILGYLVLHVWTIRFGPGRAIPAYTRVVDVVANTAIMASYLAGVAAVGLHLSHGAFSSLMTLGLRHPLHDGWLQVFGKVGAILLAAGFAVVIFWVLLYRGV